VAEVGCAGLLVEDCFCGPLKAVPSEGTLTLLDEMPVKAGGCAANVAIDLAKQDVRVDVAGCVGLDPAGEMLRAAFAAHDVGFSRVVSVEGFRTSKTVILLIEGQDRRFFHVVGANRAFGVSHLPQDWLSQLRVFYLGGLFALPGVDFARLAGLLKFCRAKGVITVVDVVVPQNQQGMAELQKLLPWVDVFVPNEDEACAFTGLTDPFDQLRSFENAGANTVIITRGAQGLAALQRGNTYSCGAYQMNVVDPSGSGDAFTAGVIRCVLRQESLPRTLCYASAVGASATRAAGTTDSVFSAAEAEAFVAARPLMVTEGP
jgi:sugar/nucleoside kinase (ribokinase family)